ncbi:RNA polymerase sigma factor RpoD/SigA [Paenarthrobacter sp. NPDC089714]|uniref:sigma-70 family RNA polymerase sigma factor n=1 Tax=Paenarthrobacter sp. NPDC089714 TaxID=3364377 RepID=UPI0037FCDFB3
MDVKARCGGPELNIEYLGRILARLQPFVHERVIRRTRVERVLGTLQSPSEGLHSEIERLLAKAGIVIEEDVARVVDEPVLVVEPRGAVVEKPQVSVDSPTTHPLLTPDPVASARRRIDRDRHIANLARILLKPEEEVGLAILVRGASGEPLAQGDFARLAGEPRAAAECLLLHNQGLVHSVAQHYAPPGMTYEDLFQHGVIGLIRAVELFDPSMGNKFSTYAMNWVRQAVTRAIANEARMIRLPVHMYERVQRVWHTRTRLTVDGVEPSVHQLALACDLIDSQVAECLLLGPQDILSLDTPVGPEGETTLGDLCDGADPNADLEREVETVLLREQIHALLDSLSEREADVVAMRFGLSDGEPKTLDEIGKVYGVTRERIRQIEKKAMDWLRHPSQSAVLRPYLFGTDDSPRRHLEPDNEEITPVSE